MKKLSNTETELKKKVAYKKACSWLSSGQSLPSESKPYYGTFKSERQK